jgi:hypothetical protein
MKGCCGKPEIAPAITPEMTVLDIVSQYRATEAVFKDYDAVAGECICCNALFDTLKNVADRYRIDLREITDALKKAAAGE